MKNLAIKSLLVLSCLSSAQAFADGVPFAWCEEGRVYFTGTGSLETQGETYVLKGSTHRYTGDSNWSLSMQHVDFYLNTTSLGSDRANLEGNARKSITFPQRGIQNVSTSWSSNCSVKRVWVQNPPSANVNIDEVPNLREDGTRISTTLTLTAKPWVDQYSKAYNGGGGYTVRWYYRGALSVPWQLVSSTNTLSDTFNGGAAYIKVVVSDGTYEDVEEFTFSPSQPPVGADPCASKPWMCHDL